MYLQDDIVRAARGHLTARQQGEFFAALVEYDETGEAPEVRDAKAAFGVALCLSRIDKAKERARKLSENGRRGGRPRKTKAKPIGFDGEKPNGKQLVSESAKPNQNQLLSEGENQNESNPIKSESESEKEKVSFSDEKLSVAHPDGCACRAEARRKATAEERREIIDHLNAMTGKAFKPDTTATTSLINARFAEGFTVADFKRVIDAKCADWIGVTSRDGRDMGEYLRPSTLFRPTNFEGYLNSEARADRPATAPGYFVTGSAEGDRELRERMGGA